jgi:hypothetical protein
MSGVSNVVSATGEERVRRSAQGHAGGAIEMGRPAGDGTPLGLARESAAWSAKTAAGTVRLPLGKAEAELAFALGALGRAVGDRPSPAFLPKGVWLCLASVTSVKTTWRSLCVRLRPLLGV